ncbi:hypothetical protein TcasGA2_TC004736 [Tribolium castaneum]|uniref:Uncharacterized protein n=1 Tax=Tribolium castaneum TaxID=7070 RepID=D6W7A1_TRICA|nr:hypothetical protein TcasGA2_TC004736 [Tribolium castaneum]
MTTGQVTATPQPQSPRKHANPTINPRCSFFKALHATACRYCNGNASGNGWHFQHCQKSHKRLQRKQLVKAETLRECRLYD